MEELVKFWQCLGFGEAAFEFWVKTCVRECAELQEAEGKELHESSTWTVQEACKSFLPHTGQLHGPCPSFGSARVFNTGHVREACALICGVARGVLLNTDRAEKVLHGSRMVQHGACSWFFLVSTERVFSSARGVQIGTGHSRFCTGPASFARIMQFSFFWGRKPNLSQYSGLLWFKNLNWIILGILLMNLDELRIWLWTLRTLIENWTENCEIEKLKIWLTL